MTSENNKTLCLVKVGYRMPIDVQSLLCDLKHLSIFAFSLCLTMVPRKNSLSINIFISMTSSRDGRGYLSVCGEKFRTVVVHSPTVDRTIRRDATVYIRLIAV